MKTVLIYSGGLDSTVLLYQLVAQGHEVFALSINYGQRHGKEIEVAKKLCGGLKVPHEVVDLSDLSKLMPGSSLTNRAVEVAEGHYEETSMKSTVVPNRNMILLSVATAWAISLKADTVAYAAHSGDHAIYPDCRESFADALDAVIRQADWHEVQLYRPFVGSDKGKITALGASLNVPLEATWSCYKGGDLHCGRCGTCIERREAFYLSGVEDKTAYAESAPALSELIKNEWKLLS